VILEIAYDVSLWRNCVAMSCSSCCYWSIAHLINIGETFRKTLCNL